MKKIIFKDQDDLQNYFKNSSLFLSKDSTLIIHEDCELEQNIRFSGKVSIGKQNKISSNSNIGNSYLKDRNIIKSNTVIINSRILNDNTIGPTCLIRECERIGNKNIIGFCVELVRTKLNNDNKISHQSFIADASIDKYVIIGASTVSANYFNGKRNKLIIGSNALIGCNTTLIAPCKIGKNSIIGAGSFVNFDIPKNKKVFQKKHTTIIDL